MGSTGSTADRVELLARLRDTIDLLESIAGDRSVLAGVPWTPFAAAPFLSVSADEPFPFHASEKLAVISSPFDFSLVVEQLSLGFGQQFRPEPSIRFPRRPRGWRNCHLQDRRHH